MKTHQFEYLIKSKSEEGFYLELNMIVYAKTKQKAIDEFFETIDDWCNILVITEIIKTGFFTVKYDETEFGITTTMITRNQLLNLPNLKRQVMKVPKQLLAQYMD